MLVDAIKIKNGFHREILDETKLTVLLVMVLLRNVNMHYTCKSQRWASAVAAFLKHIDHISIRILTSEHLEELAPWGTSLGNAGLSEWCPVFAEHEDFWSTSDPNILDYAVNPATDPAASSGCFSKNPDAWVLLRLKLWFNWQAWALRHRHGIKASLGYSSWHCY